MLNRGWIIDKVLYSILSQTYPHNRIFVLIIDGQSNDNTVQISRRILEKSNFLGYNIIVEKSSIPEGRNICIANMRGEILLFWDSDIIMEPNAIEKLVKTWETQKADIVTADASFIFLDSTDHLEEKIKEAMQLHKIESYVRPVAAAGMGATLITKHVLSIVRFDPDLTICEDLDFSIRARERGLKIVTNCSIKVLDVNIIKNEYSDIYIDMPLKSAMKSIRKKARALVLALNFKLTIGDAFHFFLGTKRYIFYIGYIPAAFLTIIGIALGSIYLTVIFPLYLLFFTTRQVIRRGVKRGTKAVFRSFLVGVPISFSIAYYFAKYFLNRNGRIE